MRFEFDSTVTSDFERAVTYEWLESNGLGGWASSTIVGAHTRRYHGLFVAATKPPVGRVVLLSRLDESFVVGTERFELSCNQYPGAVHPQGHRLIKSFSKTLFPETMFACGDAVLRKTVAAIYGENTVVVIYELLRGPKSCELLLSPFIAGRDYHSLVHANADIKHEVAAPETDTWQFVSYGGIPPFYIHLPSAIWNAAPSWYYNFEYRVEKERGLDFTEDLFTPGHFTVQVAVGSAVAVVITTDERAKENGIELVRREELRRKALLRDAPLQDDLARTLTLAADQFIVRRGSKHRTVIAGYHWFTDWGRDTMIALPGLCLVTGRIEEAKRILQLFSDSVSEGMLPNRFPDDGEQPEYNSVDATLWFFVALYHYFEYSNDAALFSDGLLDLLLDIIKHHEQGTRFNIQVREGGLLYSGSPGVQLTWMDAKIGNWVVTPRSGFAVEINALWYNALTIASELCARFGRGAEARSLRERSEQTKASFERMFWDDELGYLIDCVDGEARDVRIRPNQLLALSLPYPMLNKERGKRVIKVIEDTLYTPVGLRSLAPAESDYKPDYQGGVLARDGAYHQGTVWSWLLGPYVTAVVRFGGARGKAKAKNIIERFTPHLCEAGVGTVSEIFDGNPPHAPRGCIAQAWGVAEILRAYVEDIAGLHPALDKKGKRYIGD